MKYEVYITETLSKVVPVEAHTKEEAIEAVTKLYKQEQIVLSADDFVKVESTAEEYNDPNPEPAP